jgi:hypothetical protein
MLKYTALLTGAVVSGPFASAFLSGCTRETANSELLYFDANQFDLLTQLADTILPRTDSPSASDVNVPQTVDSMLELVFDNDFKTIFRNQWAELENFLSGQSFEQLGQSERVQLLSDLELSQDDEVANAKLAFRELKQQVIAYYLNTEEIGTEFLNYLPIPGEYQSCISIEDVNNKAWAE